MTGPLIAVLASADMDLIKPSQAGMAKSSSLVFTDMLLVIGAGVILTALLVIWALYARKKRRHRHHRHKHHHHAIQPKIVDAEPDEEEAETAEEDNPGEESPGHSGRHRHHRRRVRRRDHRGRNPTLAETGGLPPLRSPPSSATIPPTEPS